MNFLQQHFLSFTRKPYALVGLIIFAALLHIGTSIKGSLYADDYVHATYFLGSTALEKKGFFDGIGVGNFQQIIQDQFNFFDPKTKNYQALLNFGMLPWWTSEDAMLHFFRPLTSITHYIDYQLWPNSPRLMHGVNLFWYLLGVLVIYQLYRVVGVEKSVALFALLLVILDQSMFQIVTWIASRNGLMVIVFGFFAVYSYHKSMTSWIWYVLGLLSLLLAALSAEGVVAICAYLGAYMLTLDERVWWKRLLHIIPYASLILLWHGYYQQQGYGAYGVDFYVDPGHEPQAFLATAIYRLPGNFFELISGIDFMSGQIRPDIRQAFAILGLVFFAAIVWLIGSLFKNNKVLAFFFLGSCLALIPGLTIALAPRVMVIPFIGMAVVFSFICHEFLQHYNVGAKKLFGQSIVIYVLFMHICIASGLAIYTVINTLLSTPSAEQTRGYVDLGITDFADKPIVIINAFKPFWLAFYAQQLDKSGKDLPSSLRVLASAFYPMTVTRVSYRELLLEASPGFQFDSESLSDLNGAPIHYAYLTQQLMGLVRSSRDEWQVGEQFDFPEMQITVTHLYKGKPQSLAVKLKQKEFTDFRWVYWDIEKKKYKVFNLPGIGQSKKLAGFFAQ